MRHRTADAAMRQIMVGDWLELVIEKSGGCDTEGAARRVAETIRQALCSPTFEVPGVIELK